MVLIAWCLFTAVVLVVSVVINLSTFFGISLVRTGTGAGWMMVASHAPAVAAVYYLFRAGGPDQAMSGVPSWLFILLALLGVYGVANMIVFLAQSEGKPEVRDGKYVVTGRSLIPIEVNRAEYERQQATAIRGLSGLWVLASSAALMPLVGARNPHTGRERAVVR